MAFIAQVGRKAAELASEAIRTRPNARNGIVVLGRDELETLLERALIEGVRIGQEHSQAKPDGETKNPLDRT